MDGDVLHIGLCPKCGSSIIRVLSTDRPYRLIQCKICSYKWQTLELNLHRAGWLQAFVREVALSDSVKALPADFQRGLLKFITSATYTP